MSLSKNYTAKSVEGILRVLTRELGVSKLVSKEFRSIINKNTLDLAQILNGAQDPFYLEKVEVADASINTSTSVQSGSYTHATRNMNDTGHGLVTADIGKRILMWSAGRGTVSTIQSITDVDNFVTTHSFGQNLNPVSYVVLSHFSGTYIDLSTYKIDFIIKLVSSIHKEIASKGDSDFEFLSEMDEYSESVFYNHNGERLDLFMGADVSNTAWGTLTLSYYRTPNLVDEATDYIDMKDSKIPLLIDKCKLEIYEMVKMTPPQNLIDSVSNKVNEIKNATAQRRAEIESRVGKK